MVAERFERLRVVVERSALARHRARIGRIEEILVEGPSKRDPAMLSGRTPQNKLVHVPAVTGPLRPGTFAEVRIIDAGPHYLRRRAGRGDGRAPPPHPHPGGGQLTPASGAVALALVGPTASGKSALALELARHRPGLELVSVDSMQVYRGMDIGTAKPTPAEQAEVRHHLIDLVDPSEEYTVSRYSVDLAAALADIAGAGPTGPAGGGHRALPAGRVWATWRSRRRYPAVRAAAGGRARHRGPASPPRATSIRWRRPAWSRPTDAGSCGRWR